MLLPLPVVAFAAFVLAYPYLWPDPIGRTRNLLDFRAHEMENQGQIWEDTRVNGPFEAIERVKDQLGDRTSTSRWFAGKFDERFGWSWDRPGLDLGLGALGLALLGLWALMYGPRSRYALAGIVVLGEAAFIVLGMQVDFNRYHLPILLAVAVGVGFLIGQLWNGLVLAGEAIVAWRADRTSLPELAPAPRPVVAAAWPSGGPEDDRSASLSAPPRFRAPIARVATRPQSLLLAVALGLGVLIGHSWAGLRGGDRAHAERGDG